MAVNAPSKYTRARGEVLLKNTSGWYCLLSTLLLAEEERAQKRGFVVCCWTTRVTGQSVLICALICSVNFLITIIGLVGL